MGLVVDNTRDFFMLDDSLDKEGDNITIQQTHDDTMDYLYETMVLNPKKKSVHKKTKKKRRS